ncbi:MAG: hypothetical protein WD733_05595 [Bryobacterales bacterium]
MNRPKLTSQDDAGLRRMARAVLMQALDDLNQGDTATRAEARRWINSEHEAGFSFALCCKVLGCRHEVVRRGLLPRTAAAEPMVSPAHLPAQELELAEQYAS